MIWVYWPGGSIGTQASELKLHRGFDILQLGRGVTGTRGWIEGSFSLPQDDVDESADQRQREGNPRQDVGVAKFIWPHHPFLTHHRVDDGSAHHEQTGKDLEGSSEEEASALLQSEELAEEEEERQAAEDDG